MGERDPTRPSRFGAVPPATESKREDSRKTMSKNTGLAGRVESIGRFFPLGRLGLALLVVSTAGAAFALAWSAPPRCADEGCPDWAAIDAYRPPEAPHLFDRHDVLIGHLPGEVRIWVPLDSFPEALRRGVIAVEDRRFFDHRGIDGRGVARAALANVQAGDVREGASTITMQLARNLWWPGLEELGRWRRKAVEARLALRLERRLEKERILELYLNKVYLGRGVYGFGAAAHHYFDKHPGELDLAEIATLIGAVKTPERYNPRTRPEEAARRRQVVLDILAETGVSEPEAVAAARASELEVSQSPPLEQGRSYFAAAVNRELRSLIPDPAERQGVRVFTTLDPAAQAAIERRLREQIEAIESGSLGRFGHPVPGDDLGRADGDSPYLQGAAVVMDVSNGAIRGVVGGRSFEHSEFDRALLAARQPGSAFKPIVYAAALAERRTSLAEPIDTSPVELAVTDGTWEPADDQAEEGGMIVRTALARSSNWAAVRVGLKTGLGRVAGTAARLGIESPVDPVPAALLGASVVRPVELTAAYAVFANGGLRVRPHLIRRVEDRDGRVLYLRAPEATPALDPRVAFLVRQALADVVDGGTGWRARSAGYRGPAAGKTGTTDEWRDAWFVGFNGELVTGVWLGFDRPRRIMAGGFGGSLAAPLWGSIMFDLYGARRDVAPFSARPSGLEAVEIDVETGYAVSDRCPPARTRIELFIPGTEPPALCEIDVEAPQIRLTAGADWTLSIPGRPRGATRSTAPRATGGGTDGQGGS